MSAVSDSLARELGAVAGGVLAESVVDSVRPGSAGVVEHAEQSGFQVQGVDMPGRVAINKKREAVANVSGAV
jgi:hypothetical protein